MAYPGTMTETEQASNEAWMTNIIRPLAGELARVLNHAEAALTEYNGAQNNTNGKMSKLAEGDMMPNKGGLSGAEEISKTDVLTFLTNLTSLTSTYNTASLRGLYAELAGEENLIG